MAPKTQTPAAPIPDAENAAPVIYPTTEDKDGFVIVNLANDQVRVEWPEHAISAEGPDVAELKKALREHVKG